MQDKFNQSKESHEFKINNLDKSKKGDVDKLVIPLIEKINSFDDYFTTSSCSGRIMIIKPSEVKKDVEWLFYSHETVDSEELIRKIHGFANKNKEQLWFKIEGFILHIACRDMESADKLLKLVKRVGLKRSGIISTSHKIMVEIISSETLETPISKNNDLLVEDNYLAFLIDEANAKLKRTHNRIKKLEGEVNNLRESLLS